MNKPTPYDLLKECFDEIKHCEDPLKRKSILQAYAKHMEAREAEIAKEADTAARIDENRNYWWHLQKHAEKVGISAHALDRIAKLGPPDPQQ